MVEWKAALKQTSGIVKLGGTSLFYFGAALKKKRRNAFCDITKEVPLLYTVATYQKKRYLARFDEEKYLN